jgi:mannose-6-phosphate isomerase
MDNMKTMEILKNTVQEYDWGSRTAIPKLLGKRGSFQAPQAELWMGAHPKGPSMVRMGEKWVSLLELIKTNPKDILGKEVIKKFEGRLPYLFKVLAAEKPLSIQVHPNLKQAREGFARENRQGISFNANMRNYKDDNHKPECICALTDFWALNGFRKISNIISLMTRICPNSSAQRLEDLRKQPNSEGLRLFFKALITMEKDRMSQLINEALANAGKNPESDDDSVSRWMLHLHSIYPFDIGVLSPLLLNMVCLKPGQAVFIPSGQLHAYLSGMAVELMANSDNVLRCGLTSKYIDITEILRVLNFEEKEVNILSPRKSSNCESIYFSDAEEFVLSIICPRKGLSYKSPQKRGVEIILCTQGRATISGPGDNHSVMLVTGTSILIPASVKRYTIEGNATLYKAAVNFDHNFD